MYDLSLRQLTPATDPACLLHRSRHAHPITHLLPWLPAPGHSLRWRLHQDIRRVRARGFSSSLRPQFAFFAAVCSHTFSYFVGNMPTWLEHWADTGPGFLTSLSPPMTLTLSQGKITVTSHKHKLKKEDDPLSMKSVFLSVFPCCSIPVSIPVSTLRHQDKPYKSSSHCSLTIGRFNAASPLSRPALLIRVWRFGTPAPEHVSTLSSTIKTRWDENPVYVHWPLWSCKTSSTG